MNSNTCCELLTLNVGRSCHTSRPECPDVLIATCSRLLGVKSTMFVADGEPLLIRETAVDGYKVATLYDNQCGDLGPSPIAEWFTAPDEASSKSCWAAVQRAKKDFDGIFAEIEGDLQRHWQKSFILQASRPLRTPWSVEVILPHFLTSSPSIQTGICSLWPPMVWAQIDRARQPQPEFKFR